MNSARLGLWILLAIVLHAAPALARSSDLADTMSTASVDSLEAPTHKFRQVTLYFLGTQFATGGAGLGIELRSRSGRFAILAGIGRGFLDFEGLDDPIGVTGWGAGFKRYLDGGKHQFYVLTAVGPTAYTGYLTGTRDNPRFNIRETHYGNSLGIGYRYTSYRGFTFVFGYNQLWTHFDNSLRSDVDLDIGWSW